MIKNTNHTTNEDFLKEVCEDFDSKNWPVINIGSVAKSMFKQFTTLLRPFKNHNEAASSQKSWLLVYHYTEDSCGQVSIVGFKWMKPHTQVSVSMFCCHASDMFACVCVLIGLSLSLSSSGQLLLCIILQLPRALSLLYPLPICHNMSNVHVTFVLCDKAFVKVIFVCCNDKKNR